MDELLAPVFCDVAHVNWSVHIPKLVDYWCRVLLGHPGYEGRLLEPHQRVHSMEALRPELFYRWYSLFVEEVDRAWQGPVAESAKAHAARMATILARRLLNADWKEPIEGPPRGLAPPLLRPARAGAGALRKAGAGGDEHLHDRRRPGAGADLPRGTVRPQRPRRARLGRLQNDPPREGAPPDRRDLGNRLLGGPAPPGGPRREGTAGGR